MVWREGGFRVWRPTPRCGCGHDEMMHTGLGRCTAPECSCLKFIRPKRPQKRHARGTEAGGYNHHSAFEARVAADLLHQEACGELQEVRRQFPVEIRINGIFICRHYVDFRVVRNDGAVELIEAKGFWTDDSAIKRRLLEAVWLPQNPGVEYRVLRQR